MAPLWVALNGKPRFVAFKGNAIYAAASLSDMLTDTSFMGRAKECKREDKTASMPLGGGDACAVYEIPDDTYGAMQGGRAIKPTGWPAEGKLVDYGCWEDGQGNVGKDRLFSQKVDNVPAKGAVFACATQAANAGTGWFGVEGGNDSSQKECFIESKVDNTTHYTIWGKGKDCKGLDGVSKDEKGNYLPTGGDWSMQVYQMDSTLRQKVYDQAHAPTTYDLEWGPVTCHRCYRLDVLQGPVVREKAPHEWSVPDVLIRAYFTDLETINPSRKIPLPLFVNEKMD